jgi:hypothetical protein
MNSLWQLRTDVPLTCAQHPFHFSPRLNFSKHVQSQASHGVPVIGVHPPMVTPREVRDRYILASDRHRHFVNAQGTMAKQIMKENGKPVPRLFHVARFSEHKIAIVARFQSWFDLVGLHRV